MGPKLGSLKPLLTDFVKNPAFTLHIAMKGQKLDFEKVIKNIYHWSYTGPIQRKQLSQLYIEHIVTSVSTLPLSKSPSLAG